MAESTISSETTQRETLNALNYQAAQMAAGLNLQKQMSGQIISLNMNIGKVNSGINKANESLVQINNYQKAMNMNIGKVAAAVDRLGLTFKEALADNRKGQLNSSTMTTKMNILASKQDETNRILTGILNSFGGKNQYDAIENKLESKDTLSVLNSMSSSLTSIDETLKRLEKSGGFGGGVSGNGQNGILGNVAEGGGLIAMWEAAKRFGARAIPYLKPLALPAVVATTMNMSQDKFGPESEEYKKVMEYGREQQRKQREEEYRRNRENFLKSAGQASGPSWQTYGRVGPNTTMMDMAVAADVMNRNAGKPLPDRPGPSFERYGRGSAGIPMTAFDTQTAALATGITSPAETDTMPWFAPVGPTPSSAVGSAFNTREVLEQQQAQIEQQSKGMTTGDMVYEAGDIVYKASTIRFEASSIQFMGGAMGAAGAAMGGGDFGNGNGGGYNPYYNGGGPGNNYGGGDTGGVTGGKPTTLSGDAKTAFDNIQAGKKMTFGGGTNAADPFKGVSDEALEAGGMKRTKGPKGRTTYSAVPMKEGGGAYPVDEKFPTKEELRAYIRQSAIARGVDPEVALRIAEHEGLTANPEEAWQSKVIDKKGRRETSYGVFQNLIGGGTGDDLLAMGIDPRDWRNWRQGIDHSLNVAAEQGWTPWYGRGPAGVGEKEGLANAKPVPLGGQGESLGSRESAVAGGMPYTDNKTSATGPVMTMPIGGTMAGKSMSDPKAVPFHGGSQNSRSFGGRRGANKLHTGVDIPNAVGDPVMSIMDGGKVVRAERSSSGYGNVVDIEYPDGTVHRMAHLGSIGVKVGDRVGRGQVVGTGGYSGNAGPEFPHTHYEVMKADFYHKSGGRPSGRAPNRAYLDAGRIDPRRYFSSAEERNKAIAEADVQIKAAQEKESKPYIPRPRPKPTQEASGPSLGYENFNYGGPEHTAMENIMTARAMGKLPAEAVLPVKSVNYAEGTEGIPLPGDDLDYATSYDTLNKNRREVTPVQSDNSRAIQRTEQLRREEAQSRTRKIEDKKRTEQRDEQSKRNRDSDEPKNPKSKRADLDSVLVRHGDWWKNFNAGVRA
jgi:hypothetical protein